MGKIALLNKQTIDKIAAGEVVERPLNVVKELVENSIDAGSTNISVEIKDGGKTLIRITDNGSGILKDDLEIAFLRHATSKIRLEEDLDYINTLGFRGEALSSIAAVSMVEVITKTADELIGNQLRIEGGTIGTITEIGAPNGTTIFVRNLFYNTPARKKFLKSDQTEASYIVNMMEHLALSHPEISFTLIVNGSQRLQTAGNGNVKDVIYRLYGRDVVSDLLDFNYSDDELNITGYICKPGVSRGNRNYENYYINNRYIKSNMLNKAIEDGYKSFIMQHKFPMVFLYFDMDPSDVDVNVHPTKMEIRFQDEITLYNSMVERIRYTLSHMDLITHSAMADDKATEKDRKEEILTKPIVEPFEASKLNKVKEYVKNTSPYEPKYVNAPKIIAEHKQMELFPTTSVKTTVNNEMDNNSQHFLAPESIYNHRIIGQVFDTYWLVEFNESLYIIDQHAAHERILYERTMASIEKKEMSSQSLCPPMVISLNDMELNLLNEYSDQFTKIGFVFEPFGGNDIMISQVPYNMFGINSKELFISMVDELTTFSGRETPDIVLQKVAMMSCKAAVKGNQAISKKEAESIIGELLKMDNPYHCPHGRPTIIELSKSEMERRFHR